MVLVLVGLNTLIAGVLGALLFFVDVGYPKLNIVRIAILFGTALLQVVLAVLMINFVRSMLTYSQASCFVLSKNELKLELRDEEEEEVMEL